jgi:hypothetical protein
VKRYLLIVHNGGPCVGAVEVPGCFNINPQVAVYALESGFSLLVVTEAELASQGGLEGLLLKQGRHILDALHALMSDPSFDADPSLN